MNKSTLAAAIALGLGTAGVVSTASAGNLVLTFSNNTGLTQPAGTLQPFAVGSEFHVATPSGSYLNDGDKDIISGGETWTFAGTSSSSLVSALMTSVGNTALNSGHSGVNGQAALTNGIAGFPIASTSGTVATIAQGADFLGAGLFTILAPLTGNVTGQTFGAAHLDSFGAGTFEITFPVMQIQWADGVYLIGGDGDGNSSFNQPGNKCSTTSGCPGPGITLNGTTDGLGNFLLSGSQAMFKDEVTVLGFNKNFVEFSLGGTYAIVPHTVIPVPAAAWLFGSGLVGLVGVARRRRNK